MENINSIFIDQLDNLAKLITQEVATYKANKVNEHQTEGSNLEKLVEKGKNIGKAATDNAVARFMAKHWGIDKLEQAGIKALQEAGIRLDDALTKHVLASDIVGAQINLTVQTYITQKLPKKLTYDRASIFYQVAKAHNKGDLKSPESVKGKAMQVSRKLAGGSIGAFNSIRRGKILGAAASILNSGTDVLKTALGRDTVESRLRLLLLTEISEFCKRKER